MIGLTFKANISIRFIGVKVYQEPNNSFQDIEKIKRDNKQFPLLLEVNPLMIY